MRGLGRGQVESLLDQEEGETTVVHDIAQDLDDASAELGAHRPGARPGVGRAGAWVGCAEGGGEVRRRTPGPRFLHRLADERRLQVAEERPLPGEFPEAGPAETGPRQELHEEGLPGVVGVAGASGEDRAGGRAETRVELAQGAPERVTVEQRDPPGQRPLLGDRQRLQQVLDERTVPGVRPAGVGMLDGREGQIRRGRDGRQPHEGADGVPPLGGVRRDQPPDNPLLVPSVAHDGRSARRSRACVCLHWTRPCEPG